MFLFLIKEGLYKTVQIRKVTYYYIRKPFIMLIFFLQDHGFA
jgi:hypothetical protein